MNLIKTLHVDKTRLEQSMVNLEGQMRTKSQQVADAQKEVSTLSFSVASIAS